MCAQDVLLIVTYAWAARRITSSLERKVICMLLYAVSRLRDFWLRVYVGEGQLGGVSVAPFPDPPGLNPVITAGHFQFAYGLPSELIGKDLSIEASILQTSLSSQASFTAELWETIPARYVSRHSTLDPNKKYHLEQFIAKGAFGANGKVRIPLVIKIL